MAILPHGWPGEALRQTRSLIENGTTLLRSSTLSLQAITMGACAILFALDTLMLLGYLIYQVR